MLDLGLDPDAWPWIWLSAAVIFALVELAFVGGSFIILPWAVSAFIASILAFYDVPVEVQWTVFVFGGAILFFILYRWAQGHARHAQATGRRRRSAGRHDRHRDDRDLADDEIARVVRSRRSGRADGDGGIPAGQP